MNWSNLPPEIEALLAPEIEALLDEAAEMLDDAHEEWLVMQRPETFKGWSP